MIGAFESRVVIGQFPRSAAWQSPVGVLTNKSIVGRVGMLVGEQVIGFHVSPT